MSLGHGLSIPRNGLVFQYDMGNTGKSWKGKPTTNNSDTAWHTQWANAGSGVWNHDDTSIKKIFPSAVVQSFEVTTTGSIHLGIGNGTITAGTYTASCYIYIPTSAGTLAGSVPYFRSFPANTSRGALSYEGNTDWNTWPRDTWIRIEASWNNTAGDTSAYISCYLNTLGNKVYLHAPQLELSDFATPFVEGTRSNTEAIIDISSQNNTITASSLTYNTDNTFSFNGTSDWATAANINLGLDPFVTVSAWIKRTGTVSNGGYWGLGGGLNNNGINGYTNASRPNKIGWDLWGQTTFDTGVDYPLNEWVHVVWVKNASGFSTSTLKVYINGVDTALSFTSRNNSSSVSLVDGFTFGRISDNVNGYYAPGDIDQLLLYDVALSSTEISRIFESTRGRYGI